MVCPGATVLRIFDINIGQPFRLEDDYCPPPRIFLVLRTDTGGPAALLPGERAYIHLSGQSFAPQRCEGDWPPCPGPFVDILKDFSHDGSITIIPNTLQWVSHDFVEMEVEVHPSATPGLRNIFMRNPVPGAGEFLCPNCFEVLEPPEA